MRYYQRMNVIKAHLGVVDPKYFELDKAQNCLKLLLIKISMVFGLVASVSSISAQSGRLAVIADGNTRDSDDIAASYNFV